MFYSQVRSVKCACCGLTVECTHTYIAEIRDKYEGRWICGLCQQAVSDEIERSGRSISRVEALTRHMNFYKKFQSTPPTNSIDFITTIREVGLKSLGSPRATKGRRTVGDDSTRSGWISKLFPFFGTPGNGNS